MCYCPKFTDAQKSTVDTDSTSNTDIEFDRQVLPLMNVPQKDIPKKVVSAIHTEDKLDRVERHELSPEKNALRSQVRSNLRKQRERMVKNQKGKQRIQIHEIGSLVSVCVPQIDRVKCDKKRIRGQVVDVKNLKRGVMKYKVATEFGTLQGWLSSSQLRTYCGIVNITSDIERTISIREATQIASTHKLSITICNCKNGCLDKRCNCVRYGIEYGVVPNCSSHCHKGKACQLKEKVHTFPDFPTYGGSFVEKGFTRTYFSNTCTVDCWIAFFKVMQHQFPAQLERIVQEYSIGVTSSIILFIGFIRHNAFDKAKRHLAQLSGIELKSKTYDFFGNEGINVLKHLKFLVSTKSVSHCSNGNECPEKVKVTRRNDFPVISNVCPHKEEFVSIIKL